MKRINPSQQKVVSLTHSQEEVFRSFTAGANIFLTGKGGSGKSFLTRYIIGWCKEQKLSTIVCAPTGVAAIQVKGSTIHRTFGIKVDENGIIEPKRRCHDPKKLGVLGKADVVIIDEISMCRADVFAYVANTLLHVFKQHMNDGKRHQLLVVGDFFQLPPVLTTSEQDAYTSLWGEVRYAFQTKEWADIQLQTMALQESMRQTDKEFVSALDNIREGRPDFDIFRHCREEMDPTVLTICSTNRQAAEINNGNLRDLVKRGAKEHVLKSIDTGHPAPGDYPADKELHLCVGAKVMMLSNDPDKRWVNGSFAVIRSISDDVVFVTIDGTKEKLAVTRNRWTVSEYDVVKGKLVQVEKASIQQFPVRLAWAVTIHKSQGQTYDAVNIDVGGIFAEGQLYVALSRCKTLDGMNLTGKLTDEKVKVNESVLKFMKGAGAPSLTGPMLPFHVGDVTDDRYQEGWDDGYDYHMKEMRECYQEMVDNDPTVKRLCDRVAKERMKAGQAPEVRNPKGGGRKKLPAEEKHPTKAIRVSVELADILKEIGNFAKEQPERLEYLKMQCETLIENLKKDEKNRKKLG